MKVFRVQNNLGKGCYRGTFNRSWRSVEHHNNPRVPAPEYDGLSLVMHEGLIYGFKTLKQLSAWFDMSEIQKLSELGFRAYMITLSNDGEMHEGGKQVMFDPDAIISEKVLDMNEVLGYYSTNNDAVNYSKGA